MDITHEQLLINDYEELTKLLETWLPKAVTDEDAVSAVAKLIKQREEVLKEYYTLKPDQKSQLEEFRTKREEQKKKPQGSLKSDR